MPKPARLDFQTALNMLRAGGSDAMYSRLLRQAIDRALPDRGSATADNEVRDFRPAARIAVFKHLNP